MDKQGFAGLLLIDLSKAFDCIDNELQIAKLHAYGFNVKSLERIHGYLYDWIQRVKINSSFSHWSNYQAIIIDNQAYHKDQLKDLFFLTFVYVTYSLKL